MLLLETGFICVLREFRKLWSSSRFERFQVTDSCRHNEPHVAGDCQLEKMAHIGNVRATDRPISEPSERSTLREEENTVAVQGGVPFQVGWYSPNDAQVRDQTAFFLQLRNGSLAAR